MRVPCITIWQPWASLIRAGAKAWEFRRWPVPKRLIGTRIGIHAGTRPVSVYEMRVLLGKLTRGSPEHETGLKADVALPLLSEWIDHPELLPQASLLCTAIVGEAVSNDVLSARLGIPQVNDSNRVIHMNFGWPLSDVQPLEPIVPMRGRQGFWNWEGPTP